MRKALTQDEKTEIVERFNIKTTLVYRAMVYRREAEREYANNKDYVNDYKRKFPSITCDHVNEANHFAKELERREMYQRKWNELARVFERLVDNFNLTNDPEVDMEAIQKVV